MGTAQTDNANGSGEAPASEKACSFSAGKCPSCGVVNRLRGNVEIKSPGTSWCAAHEGTAVSSGDSLRVGTGSVLRLVYYTGRITQDVSAGTAVTIDEIDMQPMLDAGRKISFRSAEGVVHYAVAPSGPKPCEIAVGSTTLLVDEAEFLVETRKDGTAIKVLRGNVEVLAGKARANVGAAQMVVIPPDGSAPGKPVPSAIVNDKEWWVA